MTKSTKTILTVIISIILAGTLIWWAMKGLDFQKTWESIRQANFWWIAASVAIGCTAYYVRSERWRLLLEPLGHKPRSNHAFYSVSMNYLGNLLIPRSGEVARCTTLYTLDKTHVDQSFGTVISERVVDLICLMIMGILSLIFNLDVVLNLVDEVKLARGTVQNSGNNYGLIIFSVVIILSILFLLIFWDTIKKSPLYSKITTFIYGLKSGLKTIFQLKQRRKFIFLTFVIWLFYYLMTYLVVFALPETAHLPPAVGLYILLVGGIGMVIPASGGIGAFHSALGIGFMAMGMSKEIGVTFAFLVHTPHTMIALVLGTISLIMIGIEKRKKL